MTPPTGISSTKEKESDEHDLQNQCQLWKLLQLT